jgi:hypothetical protein
MQGKLTQFLVESPCATKSWKDISLGERAGRKRRDCWAKERESGLSSSVSSTKMRGRIF